MNPDDQNQPTATPQIPSFDLDLPPLTKTEAPETTVTVSAPTPINPVTPNPSPTPTAEDLGFPKFGGSAIPPTPTVKVETTPGGMTDEVSTTVTLPETSAAMDSGLPTTPTPTVKVETTPGGMTDEVSTTVSLPTPPADEPPQPPQQVEVQVRKKSQTLPIVGAVAVLVLLAGAGIFALRGQELLSLFRGDVRQRAALTPQCRDGVDNDNDGKFDCVEGVADPGCFPNGAGGGGACDPEDNRESDGLVGVPTPTPTVALTEAVGTCQAVIFYRRENNAWVKRTGAEITSMGKAGEEIRIAVAPLNENQERARFRINGGDWEERETKNEQGEFYTTYVLANIGAIRVEAELGAFVAAN